MLLLYNNICLHKEEYTRELNPKCYFIASIKPFLRNFRLSVAYISPFISHIRTHFLCWTLRIQSKLAFMYFHHVPYIWYICIACRQPEIYIKHLTIQNPKVNKAKIQKRRGNVISYLSTFYSYSIRKVDLKSRHSSHNNISYVIRVNVMWKGSAAAAWHYKLQDWIMRNWEWVGG